MYLQKARSRKTLRPRTSITGSGSTGQRHGSADPDLYQNVTDPHYTTMVTGIRNAGYYAGKGRDFYLHTPRYFCWFLSFWIVRSSVRNPELKNKYENWNPELKTSTRTEIRNWKQVWELKSRTENKYENWNPELKTSMRTMYRKNNVTCGVSTGTHGEQSPCK
jgi:hypothetical protein